jgi:hypothetical protein
VLPLSATGSSTSFVQQAKLTAPVVESFGVSDAISGDGNTALIGAPNDGPGSVWVFSHSGSTWTQQAKLLPNDLGAPLGDPVFGEAVAISGDGDTALIGAPGDTTAGSPSGAFWIFTRSGSTWTQQGPRLVPPEISDVGEAGFSVSLSSDGNTALIGDPSDNLNVGAAFVYTRSGGVWTESQKLTGSGEVGAARFGDAVAISGDGTTALVGGPHDSSNDGAVWAFALSGGGWSQQGPKIVPNDEVGSEVFGASVALSADGNTGLVGAAPVDALPDFAGDAWAFTRSGGAWTQQGSKLTRSGEVGPGDFGASSTLSADGNTALIGGDGDAGGKGAAWEYTRSGVTWTQQGSKITPTDEVGVGTFGFGISLSSDGGRAVVGGLGDNAGIGAAWVFVASGVTVTGATGGSAISADNAGGSFTALTGPALTESAPGLIGTGTVVLNAPSGFAFDASGSPACSGTSSMAASVTLHTASAITCTVTVQSSATAGVLTFTGITVRPTAGTPLASGSITESGSASLSGASGSYGSLAEVAGAASKLAFTGQPGGAVRGATLSAAPAVTIEDQFGNQSSSGATVALAITSGTGAAGATLGGTTSKSGPVASFGGLSVSKSGTAYSLHATSGGLTPATSGTFDVTGVGSLVFQTQPIAAGAGAAFTTQPVVAAKRDDGTAEPTSTAISLSIKAGTGTAGAALGGTASVPAVGGVATFGGLSIDKAGSGYVLTAAGGGAAADSSPLTVGAGTVGTGVVPDPGAPAGLPAPPLTPTPAPPTALAAGLSARVNGRNLVLNASGLVSSGSAASYAFQLGTDGKANVTCPGQDPLVSAQIANAVTSTATVTVTTKTGTTVTATTPIVLSAPAGLPTYSIAGTSFAATSNRALLAAGTQLGQVQAVGIECLPPTGNPSPASRSINAANLGTGDTGPTVAGAAANAGCITEVDIGIVQGLGCFTEVGAGNPLPAAEALLLCKYQKFCSTIGSAVNPPAYFIAHGGTTTRAIASASASPIDQLGFDAIYFSRQPIRVDGVEIDPVNGGSIVLAHAGTITSSFLSRSAAYLISSDAEVKIAGIPVDLTVPNYGATLTQLQNTATCAQSVVGGNTGCLNGAQIPSVPSLSSLQVKVHGPVEIAVDPRHAGIELGEFKVPGSELPIPALPQLPLTGSLKVTLNSSSSASVSIHVMLPHVLADESGNGLTGDTTLTLDNQHGLDVTSLHIFVPSFAQLGLARLKQLSFTYVKATQLFDGSATLDLSDEVQGVIHFHLVFEHGSFQLAHVDYTANLGEGYPFFGPTYITFIGADVSLSPTTVTGKTNISVGPAITTDGCGLFGAQGTATMVFDNPVLLDLHGETQIACATFGYSEDFHADSNGNVGYGVGIDYPIPGFGSLTGTLYGQAAIDLNSGAFHFQIDGGVHAVFGIHECVATACVDDTVDAGATATWSDKGAGVCAHINVLGAGFDVGAGIDNLGSVVQTSIVSGGTLTEAALLQNFRLLASDCSLSRWQTLQPPPGLRSTQGATASEFGFTATPGEHMAVVGLQGKGGAPDVTLTAPDGRKITPPVKPGLTTFDGMLFVRQPTSDETLVEIPNPAAGRWVVGRAAGSAPIVKAETAQPLPAPTIAATVTGTGASRVLHYRVSPQPGLTVSFLERVDRGARIIGTAKTATGEIPFTSGLGSAKPRAIVAVLTRNGVPAGRMVVAHYTPTILKPGRPGRIRVRHTRAGWRISFRPGPNTTDHLITVRFADGAQALLTSAGKSFVIVPPKVDTTQPVTIRVVGVRAETRGPAAVAGAKLR